MKPRNKLFAISTIYVPVMLILMFYPQIHNFYTYSVPLNGFTIERWAYSTPETFSKMQIEKDSTCFTDPAKHFFCYEKPRMFQDEIGGVSYITSNAGIDGELHFNRTDKQGGFFTEKSHYGKF